MLILAADNNTNHDEVRLPIAKAKLEEHGFECTTIQGPINGGPGSPTYYYFKTNATKDQIQPLAQGTDWGNRCYFRGTF